MRSSVITKVSWFAIVALLISPLAAPAALLTYNQTVNQLIPDNSASGYATTINISGVSQTAITDVNVVLHLSGEWNGDLYLYLVHNNTTTAVLLNRVGVNGSGQDGFGHAGFDVVLSDQASGHAVTDDIHRYATAENVPTFSAGRLTGTWQPDGRLVDPSVVVNGDARTALLGLFNGQDPNGTWTLYVADMAGGYQSTLDSWGLEIEAVPEPVTSALVIFSVVLVAVKGLAHWRRRRLSPSGREPNTPS